MKKIILLACLLVSQISFSQNQQARTGNHLPPEDPSHQEKKSGLKKMISDRNRRQSGNYSFGPMEDAMIQYNNNPQRQAQNANWNYVPSTGNYRNDVGRATSITFDTLTPGKFYVCSNNSGVWLTLDNGQTYSPITENLPTQSVSKLVIDYSNPNVLYLATGMHNMDMPFNSLGIFKSTDGGQNWNSTGLSFTSAQQITIGDLVMNPFDPNTLLAASSDGVYKTYNGGTSWTKVIFDDVRSIRYHPMDTNIVYATGLTYYRSGDGGNTFSPNMNGIYNGYQWHYEHFVRTTKIAPNVVYLMVSGLVVNPNFNPSQRIYKSTDSGINFFPIDSIGGEVCAQFEVSQKQEDRFLLGYRRTFKKENASSPFVQVSDWYGTSLPYMHADQRGLAFSPNNDSTFYYCNDGGLYISTDNAQTFQNITGNMQLAHLYTFSHSQQNPYKILTSPLDVSPFILGNNGIVQTFTDLIESFSSSINPLNDNKFWIAHQTPNFTINNGISFYLSSSFEISNMVRSQHNFQYNDCDENVSYYGSYNNIFKSTDNGLSYFPFVSTNYNPVNAFLNSPVGFVVSRARPDYIYVYYPDSIYLSTEGNSNFNNISSGLPIDTADIAHLAVDPTNEKRIWVSFRGYADGNKVFYSDDAGQNWTNLSAGLPNLSVNKIIPQHGVAGAVYAATDGGVFYRDDTFSTWQYFNDGMPAAIVNDLEIQYSLGKIRAATFGRGVWESDFYSPTPASYLLPPVALFEVNNSQSCIGEMLQFSNNSCGTVDSVRWIFPGGNPATSNNNNPVVVYNASGNYDVTLIAYNTGGIDTLTKTSVIQVIPPLALPYIEPVGNVNAFVYPPGCYAPDENNDNNTWLRIWYSDGSGGTDDDYLQYNNWNFNNNGNEEKLFLPPVDLSGTSNPKLFFYRSYQRRNTSNNDTLIVYGQSCGTNQQVLYKKGGAQLANIPGFQSGNYWMPSLPNHWVKDSVILNPVAGESWVRLNFSNKGYGGQIVYIDDFKVMETPLITKQSERFLKNSIQVYPNPVADELVIERKDSETETIVLYDLPGKKLLEGKFYGSSCRLSVGHLDKGIYLVKVGEQIFKIEKQ